MFQNFDLFLSVIIWWATVFCCWFYHISGLLSLHISCQLKINLPIPTPSKSNSRGEIHIIHVGSILFHLLLLYFTRMAAVLLRVYRKNNMIKHIPPNPRLIYYPWETVKFFNENQWSVSTQLKIILKKRNITSKFIVSKIQALKRGVSLCFL